MYKRQIEDAADEDETEDAVATEAGDDAVHADAGDEDGEDGEPIETVGGAEDEVEDAPRARPRMRRHYKIQEVIKRRQIILVQVTKEERGNKGAALTSYISLAGRYCVLMPNAVRGGGISRKITNIADRRRLKEVIDSLDVPEGMGVILRTAGLERSKPEIRRDYDFLMRVWDEIREKTLSSRAPAVIYEEASLIKRAIRDTYSQDIDEILVEGDAAYRAAREFMNALMPTHVQRVTAYTDPSAHIFPRYGVESQLDALHSHTVRLRSGGYIVLNATEALVAIDVNSGRATRERHIEETAVKTNLEAADEIARQLRLRDLAGIVVIDFIDMEDRRNNAAVERRLKEALKNDRARIQMGRISQLGLIELSRQRLRPSLFETSMVVCPTCAGHGSVRSVESTALYVFRSIEEDALKRRNAEVAVYVPTPVALYILNHKRHALHDLERANALQIMIECDDGLVGPAFRIEQTRVIEPVIEATYETVGDDEDDTEIEEVRAAPAEPVAEPVQEERTERPAAADAEDDGDGAGGPKRRRRGRRGGRRRGGRRPEGEMAEGETAADETGEVGTADAASEDRVEAPAVQVPAAPAIEPEPVAARSTAPMPSPEEPTAPIAVVEATPAEAAVTEATPAEAASEEPAPKPKPRRTRKPKAAAATAAAETAEAPAPAEAAPAPADEEKPRKPRTRRTTKPKAASEKAEEKVEAKAEAAPAKAPRPRRTRRTATDKAATETQAEASTAAPAAAQAPAAPTPAPAPQAPAAPAPAERPKEPATADASEGSQPRRRGWWQRPTN